MTMESNEKKVDESWKEQVEKERKMPPPPPQRPAPPPPPQQSQPQQPQSRPQPRKPAASPGGHREMPVADFNLFLSSLSMQAMVALGEVAHPATGAPQEDLEQARYLIDVLGILQEKTQGNLTQEESGLLEGLLYELRMKFVEKTQGPGGPAR